MTVIKSLCVALAMGAPLALAGPAVCADADAGVRVERGRAIAESICWACHVVGPGQRFSPILREPGPDFRAIARYPNTSAQSLKTFLQDSHRFESKPYAMPDPRLTTDMVDEVVSYILSLRQQP